MTAAARINYAVLGNAEPHLHVHLIPRSTEEAKPTRPPWEHPQGSRPLQVVRSGRLLQRLKDALAG